MFVLGELREIGARYLQRIRAKKERRGWKPGNSPCAVIRRVRKVLFCKFDGYLVAGVKSDEGFHVPLAPFFFGAVRQRVPAELYAIGGGGEGGREEDRGE